ncbi:hypothetical protein ACIGDI_28030 [Streptomyces sp. NPDC085900]|uniref:hypothetical protein n=1 Tax=Streptomyces sp. NPDC085900 TaxID=3365737 RepID=UPI0037D57899
MAGAFLSEAVDCGFGSPSYVDVVRDRTAQDDREAHPVYIGERGHPVLLTCDRVRGDELP